MENIKTILDKVETALQEAMEKKSKLVGQTDNIENNIVSSRLTTLRLIKSELIRQNEKNYHTNLEYKMTENEEVKLLLKMAEDHKENIKGYEKSGNTVMSNKEREELSIIEEFTPSQPTEEEMKEYVNSLITTLIAERGADYKLQQRDMGVLMKESKKKYPNINGNIVKLTLESRMT